MESFQELISESLQAAGSAVKELPPLLEAAGLGVYRWDVATNQVWWSSTYARLSGLDGEPPLEFEAFLANAHEEDRDAMRDRLVHAASNRETYEVQRRIIWPDGTTRWLACRGMPHIENDTVLAVIVIVVDDTDRHLRAQEQALVTQRQSRAGEQALQMHRVAARLSEAVTVEEVCHVLIAEGANTLGAPISVVSLCQSDNDSIQNIPNIGALRHPEIHLQSLVSNHPAVAAIKEVRSVLLDSPAKIKAEFPELFEQTQTSGISSIGVFPIATGTIVHGSWILAWERERSFPEGELIVALTLASHCGQALERARAYERERLISTSLQRTLMPQRLPIFAELSTARRYIPRSKGVEIGGDWYDMLALPTDRIGIVIGDVGGHNIDAAGVMTQLRTAIRAYAWEGNDPARVMELTNSIMSATSPGVLATCCYVELHLTDGIASICLAGHPPPLIRRADGTTDYLDSSANLPLGTTTTCSYSQSTVFFRPYDTLLLYTDGVVETRDVGLADGMTVLRDCIAGAAQSDPEDLADCALAAIPGMPREDDSAVLVLRYEPSSRPDLDAIRTVRRKLPPDGTSVAHARHLVSDLLEEWGERSLAQPASLCASEIVTNSLVHTLTDIELVINSTAKAIRISIIDQSEQVPIVRSLDNNSISGRGLQIVQAIADRWGCDLMAGGKSVWFEFDRSNH